jgi:hypothetical protein
MMSYVDDKSAACHVNFLSAESIPFCKGGSIIMGRVDVGVLHMQSFWDSKVIKPNFHRRSTLFLWSWQKSSFIFVWIPSWSRVEYLRKYTLFACRYIHNSTVLYLMFISIQHVTSCNRVTHSCRCAHPLLHSGCACIWHSCVTLLQLVTCCISTHVQYNSGVIYSICPIYPHTVVCAIFRCL